MVEWTKEKLAGRSNEEIESLRENATTRGRQDIVNLCNEELASRRPARTKKISVQANDDHSGHYVAEFHFVSPTEMEITRNPDGTIWTGVWVVKEKNAKDAAKYGAVVALHRSKAEPSYLQGIVKDWRKRPRQDRYSGDRQTQTRHGIDFLLQPSDAPLPWKGDGTGEKGYAWEPYR